MRSYSLFIGIDISKNWIDVCLTLDGKIRQMPHGRFDNDAKGFKAMLKFIKQNQLYPEGLAQCVFCMEHTGVYTLPLCRFLQSKKVFYTLVSPYHLKHTMGLRRSKSDVLDAAFIARYAYLHEEELVQFIFPSDKLLIIKNLLSLRARLVKTKKSLTIAEKELRLFAASEVSKLVTRYSKSNIKATRHSIDAVEKQIMAHIQEEPELNRLFDLLTSIKGEWQSHEYTVRKKQSFLSLYYLKIG